MRIQGEAKRVMQLFASSCISTTTYSTRESKYSYFIQHLHSDHTSYSHASSQFLNPGMSGRPAYPNADYSILHWPKWNSCDSLQR